MAKENVNLRMSPLLRRRANERAERWCVDRTQVIEQGVALLTDDDLAASVGDGLCSAQQALHAWALILDRATADNAEHFSRDEWCFLADCNNGASALFFCHGDAMRLAQTMLVANVVDGHDLNRTGYRWFEESANQRVQGVVEKLKALDHAHVWAVLVAIQFFWDHSNISPLEDPWWTREFRRQTLAGERPKE